MHIDLLAGTRVGTLAVPLLRPRILVLDSGVGGLTVLSELARARPDADYVYAADDAAFPYGDWPEAPLIERVAALTARLVAEYGPDLVVVACNTISTLVLPTLRARFDVPFVGTVPAVKPAAARSRSGRICVLATPGTVKRDYTRELIGAYAGTCEVDLVGSVRLAGYAEAEMSGRPVEDSAIRDEIAPCFIDRGGRRTDAVVLACTHYPLLLPRFQQVAPWAATWIDPAPAIGRRVAHILGDPVLGADTVGCGSGQAVFTGTGAAGALLHSVLRARGLDELRTGFLPVA